MREERTNNVHDIMCMSEVFLVLFQQSWLACKNKPLAKTLHGYLCLYDFYISEYFKINSVLPL